MITRRKLLKSGAAFAAAASSSKATSLSMETSVALEASGAAGESLIPSMAL